jgi:hypothetical protein
MSVTTLLALEEQFYGVLRPAKDLIQIHKRNPSQGRRVADLSLNKGAVVFAVAAWQAYVQSLAEAILLSLAPPPSDPTAGVYRLLAGRLRDQVRRFNTPNAANTVEILGLVGFDPRPGWSFVLEWERQVSRVYGSMKSRKKLTRTDTVKELDAWLLVRHRIAHGDTLPSDVERVSGTDRGKPQLVRQNADRCTSFFEALVHATAREVSRTIP